MENFTRVWALELAEDGVRVNAISPGAIRTNIWNVPGLSPEEAKAHEAGIAASVPCKRFGQLAYFAVDAPGFRWDLAAAYRKDTHLLHIARLFMDALKQQWKPEAAPGP